MSLLLNATWEDERILLHCWGNQLWVPWDRAMFLEEQLDKVGRDENSWYVCTGEQSDGLVDKMAAELNWGSGRTN